MRRPGAGVETYFTIEEIAKYLNYAEKTIRKWVLNREIPYIKIHQTIRFRLSEIERWVEKNKVCTLLDENGKKIEAGTLCDENEAGKNGLLIETEDDGDTGGETI
jgi:excisionase family DNA binding protein